MKKQAPPAAKAKPDISSGFFVQGISAKSVQQSATISSTTAKKITTLSSNSSPQQVSQVHKSVKPSNPQKGVPLKSGVSKQTNKNGINQNSNQNSGSKASVEPQLLKIDNSSKQMQIEQKVSQKEQKQNEVKQPIEEKQPKQIEQQKEETKVEIVKHEPVLGKVAIKYNHYNEQFDVTDGKLPFANVDEKYCFSFVFKGNYNLNLKHTQTKEYQKSANKIFENLIDGQTYIVEVDEDPEEVDKEISRPYKAPNKEESTSLKNNARMDHITSELKGMSIEELKDKGDKYKELIEARDLEDVLYK